MGAHTQGVMWPTAFCDLLVAGGRYVVRYDNRDTGKSTWLDFDRHPYTVLDMAGDAIAVLDAIGIERAHVVGGSMGGMIAQEIAVNAPHRVASLTSMMSTPGRLSSADASLPAPDPTFSARIAELSTSPRTTRADKRRSFVETFRALSGTMFPFDEAWITDMFELQFDRAGEREPNGNHGRAIAASDRRADRLTTVTAPTLVIHGTADPIVPYRHGIATSELIPGAKLLLLDGLGHELTPAASAPVAEAILRHTG